MALCLLFIFIFSINAGCVSTEDKVFTGKMPTGSMMDTIMPNATFIFDSRPYEKQLPERFDIIAFKLPDDPSQSQIKRIIGLPGETISIVGGKVYINDEAMPLNEDYLKEIPYEEDLGPYSIPEGSYFLLGDNRNNSADSRFWNNKFVPNEYILGKVTSWENP